MYDRRRCGYGRAPTVMKALIALVILTSCSCASRIAGVPARPEGTRVVENTGQLTPHISSEGGVSRRADGTGLPWCADYAASVSAVPVGQWVTLGFTYDGRWIRAYFNGVLETRPVDPVKDRRTDPLFHGRRAERRPSRRESALPRPRHLSLRPRPARANQARRRSRLHSGCALRPGRHAARGAQSPARRPRRVRPSARRR